MNETQLSEARELCKQHTEDLLPSIDAAFDSAISKYSSAVSDAGHLAYDTVSNSVDAAYLDRISKLEHLA